ncbi:MAG TPA: DUF2130 domain-containing protein [Chryseosolibacter sp.]
MELIQATALQVKCPHCGNKFNPEDSIGHDLRVQLEYEFEKKMSENSKRIEERVRRQENEKFSNQLKLVEEDRRAKTQRLLELENSVIAIRKRERELTDREERIETEMKRRLLDREKLLKDELEHNLREKLQVELYEREQKLAREREQVEIIMKRRLQEEAEKVREEERLKNAELQKKLDDQVRLVNEMKRKSDQGSMQMQGEVQELAIESYLQATFSRDAIEEVSKGKRGGDCVHIVKDDYQRVCGKILYESKRTKHFSYEWISKMKDDMRLQQADLGVIVTDVFPDGMTRFGLLDGIWVCSFVEFKALAVLFRHNLIRIGEVIASQENKGDKTQMIYQYVTGNEFKQKLEASFESYRDMLDDLQKEKTLLTSQWAKREKRLMKAMESLVSLYGDVRGIAGGAVQEIRSLELPENLLEES